MKELTFTVNKKGDIILVEIDQPRGRFPINGRAELDICTDYKNNKADIPNTGF